MNEVYCTLHPTDSSNLHLVCTLQYFWSSIFPNFVGGENLFRAVSQPILLLFFIFLSHSDEDIVEYLVSQCVSLKALISSNSKVIEWRSVLSKQSFTQVVVKVHYFMIHTFSSIIQ